MSKVGDGHVGRRMKMRKKLDTKLGWVKRRDGKPEE